MKLKRLLAIAITGSLIMSSFTVNAAELTADDINLETAVQEIQTNEQAAEMQTGYYVSPFYRETYTEDELSQMISTDVAEISGEDELVGVSVNSFDEAVTYVRSQLKARNSSFEIIGNYNGVRPDQILDAALQDDGTAPDEGDYLAANIYGSGYSWSTSFISFNMQYMDDASKEAAVTAAIPGIISGLGLSSTASEYDKVKAIHDFLSARIVYTDDGSLTCHSTYAALISGRCVCQGYASSFLRLARTMGIKAKYITGSAGGPHAWNIVKIDNKWYNIDCTWDDQSYGVIYTYFLRCNTHLVNHNRDTEYMTTAYMNAYPMSETCYTPIAGCGEKAGGLNRENVATFSYTTIDGSTVNNVANGKPKLMVFYSTTCGNSKASLKSIAGSDWVKDGKMDIIALKTNTTGTDFEEKAAAESFRSTYCNNSNDIKFVYKNRASAHNLMWEYAYQNGTTGDITWPAVVLLDRNNKVQFYSSGLTNEATLASAFSQILDDWSSSGGTTGVKPTSVALRIYPDEKYVDGYNYKETTTNYSLSLNVGESAYIKGYVYPENAGNIGVSGSSSNPAVATYDNTTGKITAIGAGSASIVISANGNQLANNTVNVKVRDNSNNNSGNNTSSVTGGSVPFSDVKANAWYTDSIQYVYEKGIMNGYSKSNKFGVNDNLTREQFATMLYRMQGEPGITFSGRFSDVRPGQYYSNAIEWCAANGIVTGYTNSSRFGVGDKIQRQQLAAMIYRYAKYVGKNVSDSASVDSFPDRNQIDSYATDPLKWCVGKGILTGKNKGGVYYLDPKGKATRAECATMITRFMTK